MYLHYMYIHTFAPRMAAIDKALQQSKFSNEYHKLAVNILYTASWLEGEHQQLLKPYGITMQQYNILRILRGQKGKPLSVNSLIERMIDKNSNASRLVDKLMEKAMVKRDVCPEDRRKVEVRITDEGMNLLSSLDYPLEKMKNLLTGINEKEAENVNRLLDKMRTTASNETF